VNTGVKRGKVGLRGRSRSVVSVSAGRISVQLAVT
jgi:hypothetical protein